MAAHTPDGDLVTVIGRGGTEARAAESELCRRFGARIRLYGLRHLRDPVRADDLVQSVLLGVLQAARAGRIAEREKVDRFVLGTCRNVALRMRDREARTEPTSHEELPEPVTEPLEVIEPAALVRCLDALDVRARQVVWLSFNEERSADEIAQRLAISRGNVRVVRHRALAALRRCLDGAEQGSA
jgi:RNA polymerase sigma-70 factor, ECF subfamily